MPRIAKAPVHSALTQAAQNILDAGGRDGVTSKRELQKAVKELPKAEAALTRQLYAFADHRDSRVGDGVTRAEIRQALGYAKKHVIDAKDTNANGLSAVEMRAMSNLGKLAVAMAAELNKVDGPSGPLSTAQLGKAINAAMKDVIWMSEGDSTPAFVSVRFPAGTPMTKEKVLEALKAPLTKWLQGSEQTFADQIASVSKLSKKDLKDLATPDPDSDDGDAFAAGFAKFKALAEANLTDMVSVRVGGKDEDGKMAESQGGYARFMVGRTRDGQLAGIMFEVVET